MNNSYLGKLKANPMRASQLRSHMDYKLIESIEYLTETKLNNAKKLAAGKVYFRGYVYSIHKQLLDTLRKKNYEQAQKHCAFLNNLTCFVSNEHVITLDKKFINAHACELYTKTFTNDDNYHLEIDALPTYKFNSAKTKIQKAFNHIETADALIYQELQTYIQEILLVKTTSKNITFDSGSDFNCYGTVCINADDESKPWMFYLESLVHEAAHMHLFALNTLDTLIENKITERYSAPLRADLRSMSGVFHATFVIARILYAFNSILKQCKLTKPEKTYISNLINDYKFRFNESKKIILQHGKLSTLAKEILADANNFVRRLS